MSCTILKCKNTGSFSILLLIAVLFTACDWGNTPYKVDVTNIQADLKIKRFEKDLRQVADTNQFSESLKILEADYPVFFPVFKSEIFGWHKENDSAFVADFRAFVFDPYVQEVYDTVEFRFGNFSKYEAELQKAFKHYKYYFPEREIPEIVTFVSNFTYASFTIDSSVLAIGLDMFLGDTFKYYSSIFPEYLTQTLKPEYLTANCMNVVGSMVYDISPENNALLSAMISAGKELHFIDRMMPSAPDYQKIGYTPEQTKWCKENEGQIWNFFIEKDLLFNTNQSETKKFMSPGPSTPGMPKDSPGKIGVWTGWQIVRSYVLKNPETKLDELMELKPEEILSGSRYKPRV
ncbi:MAG: hypothetical protein WD048_16695 [Chitinophagales bacterium]